MSTSASSMRRFGRGAIATPANFVTLGRVLLAVPTFVVFSARGASWLATVLWFVLTVTDKLDGYLARRDGTTRSGAFLDPIADKFIVLGALVVLAEAGEVTWLPVLLIGGRELGVSLYRTWAGRRGVSMPSRFLGKWKTFVQFLAVGAVIFPPTASLLGLQQAVLWFAVGFTLVSGLDVVLRGRATARAEA